MGNVRRVYVEKKPDFAVKAKELKHEVKALSRNRCRSGACSDPL